MSDCTLCRDGYNQCGPIQTEAVPGTDPPLCGRCTRCIVQNNENAEESVREDAAIKFSRLEYRPCPDEGGFMRWASVGAKIKLCVFCHRSSSAKS